VLVAVACALVYLVINHRIFDDPAAFRSGFGYERQHGVTHHQGIITMRQPNTFFVAAVLKECQWHILTGAAVFCGLCILRWRQTSAWQWLLIVFTGGYLAALSWTILPFHRYALPVVVLVHFMAALGVLRLAQTLPRPWRIAVPIAMAVLIVGLQGWRCLDFLDQFPNDSRTRLRQYVSQELASSAFIVADNYASLVTPRSGPTGLRATTAASVRSLRYAPEAGDLDYLRRMSYTHVVVADLAYFRFFDPRVLPAEEGEHTYQRYRAWYERLFREHELIWHSHPATPTYAQTNPELRVYRLLAPR
jgi:hypothetical protein